MKKKISEDVEQISTFRESEYSPDYSYIENSPEDFLSILPDISIVLGRHEDDCCNENTFFSDLLYIRDQSHAFHWQTYSNSEHLAFGKYYEKYSELLDDLVESIIGATGRRPIFNSSMNIKNYTKDNVCEFLDKVEKIIRHDIKNNVDESFTEIYNLSDEILAETQKLKYRLSLH